MTEQHSKIVVQLSARVKFLLVGLLVGAVVGVCAVLFLQNYNPKDEESSAMEVTGVFERIVEQNELVSVSQDYSFVEKAADSSRLFDIIDVPFTESSFWYRYVGTIKAGISLDDAEFHMEGSSIVVSLSNPYVISNECDMERTGVLEENNNLINPIHVADVDALQADCKARGEQEAIEGGLLEEARVEAENNIRNLFYAALGDEYTVEFDWKSAEGEEGASEA